MYYWNPYTGSYSNPSDGHGGGIPLCPPGMENIPMMPHGGELPHTDMFPQTTQPGMFPQTTQPGMFPQTTQPGMFPQTTQPGMFPQTMVPPQPSGSPIPGTHAVSPASPFVEESYVENILRMNLGKIATIYMTFENNSEWNAKVFKGRLEAAGRDHIIISDPATGRRYLLLMVNLDYITFDEPLTYAAPALPSGVR